MQTEPQKVKHILLVGKILMWEIYHFNSLIKPKTGNYAGVTVASHQRNLHTPRQRSRNCRF